MSKVLWTEKCQPSAMPAKARKIAEHLEAIGWNVRTSRSETLVQPPPNKTGPKAGIAKPEKQVIHSFLLAWTKGIALDASWNGGSFVDAVTKDPVSDIWETEDGKLQFKPGLRLYDKWGEFESWLDIVAPQPAEEVTLFED